MTAVVFREAAKSVVFHDGAGPIGPTIADLAPYIISDMAGYTVELLGAVPVSLILRDSGREMVMYVGMPPFAGIIENLTPYTILALDPYTIAQLDDL